MCLRFVWPNEVLHLGFWIAHSWPISIRMLGGPRGWRFFGLEYDRTTAEEANRHDHRPNPRLDRRL